MNQKIKTWIDAARLRTLPLSISGILVGTGLAIRENLFSGRIFILALLTTLGLQILSNFANDYGDGVKGTDNEDRVGPTRALQSGIITHIEMKKAIILTAILTFITALFLIFTAFNRQELIYVFLFMGLGVLAILAAIKYTVGKSAYGYYGLGDLFVFLFFGLLSVVGSYFLYSKQLNSSAWVLGSIIGLLSTAVINLNNMRDLESDQKAGKHTLAVKLGKKKVKVYHCLLIVAPLLISIAYILIEATFKNLFILLAFIPLWIHLRSVLRAHSLKALDPELKKVALSTFLFAVIYIAIGLF